MEQTPDLTGLQKPVRSSLSHTLFLASVLALLLSCGAPSWKQDPEVRAAKEACQDLKGPDLACVERHAVEALNPDVCRLLGIAVDDLCLQGVYEAAGDPSICDQLYLEGVRPTCRAYDAALPPPLPTPQHASLRSDQPFRSDRYHLEASQPPGWAAAEGPAPLARPFTGLGALGSWGRPGIWAPEVWT